MPQYPHISAHMTEQYQRWVEIATTALTGEYAIIPIDAGPHPTITNGRVDYGAPVPRATWRRNLPPPTPQTCKVFKPPYKHHSAQVRG